MHRPAIARAMPAMCQGRRRPLEKACGTNRDRNEKGKDMYSRNTKFEDLFNQKKISRRTLNRLVENNFLKIGQLCDNPAMGGFDLTRLGGFGKKTIDEIRQVLSDTYDISEDIDWQDNGNASVLGNYLSQAYESAMSMAGGDEGMVSLVYPTSEGLHRRIMQYLNDPVMVFEGHTKDENIRIRSFCLDYVRELIGVLERNGCTHSSVYPVYKDVEQMLSKAMREFTLYEETLFARDKRPLGEYMQLTYERLVEGSLSRRARNYIGKNLPTYEKLLGSYDENAPVSEIPGRGAPTKTFKEIKDLYDVFRVRFLECCRLPEEEVMVRLLAMKYPFLDTGQCEFMGRFIRDNGYVPLFYLIASYVMSSSIMCNRIVCDLNGFGGAESPSLDEVARTYGYTRERVRQLNVKGIDFCGAEGHGPFVREMMNVENLEHYSGLLGLPFVSKDSPECLDTMDREHFPCGFRAFAKILSTLDEGFTGLRVAGEYVMVRKGALPANISDIIAGLKSLTKEKYTHDALVTYGELVGDAGNMTEAVPGFLRYVATVAFGLEAGDEGIVMSRNTLDFEEELYLIMKERLAGGGDPMSLADIFSAFNEKFPEYAFEDPAQVRYHLFKGRNRDRIGCVGKTSRYTLKSSNHNMETIRNVIRLFLGGSDEPRSLADIFAAVSEHYPNTNAKSLVSSMQTETSGCFVEYEGRLWGMRGKTYDGRFLPKDVVKHEKFPARIREFKEFVEANRRFPACGPSVTRESSLYRWCYNVRNGIIKLDADQAREFQAMMREFEAQGYPQNGKESNFRARMVEFMDFVARNRALPTPETAPSLHAWYARARKECELFTDMRTAYLEELDGFLESLGLDSKG